MRNIKQPNVVFTYFYDILMQDLMSQLSSRLQELINSDPRDRMQRISFDLIVDKIQLCRLVRCHVESIPNDSHQHWTDCRILISADLPTCTSMSIHGRSWQRSVEVGLVVRTAGIRSYRRAQCGFGKYFACGENACSVLPVCQSKLSVTASLLLRDQLALRTVRIFSFTHSTEHILPRFA
jgi:hypothetical protein